MQVVILIGGLGTRLYPLTFATPKSLLPIANRPFVSLLFDWLARHGATRVVFAVSHFASAILEFVRRAHPDMPLVVRHEEEPLGSGGALRNCEDLLEPDFLLLNGDILMDLDLGELVRTHREAAAVVTATVAEVDEPSHYGILDVRGDGRVAEWQEKPAPGLAKSRWANVGAWAMSRRVLDFIPRGKFVSLEKETFPLVLRDALPFHAYRFRGYWKDIGTVDKYVQANRDLLAGRLAGVRPPGTETTPGVWVEDAAAPPPGVEIRPPVLIGQGCAIGAGALIAGPSVVGAGARIGAGSRIESSIVWPGAEIGAGVRASDAVIGASVIGEGCVLGPGCVVAPHSRLAPRTVIAPGAALGPGTRIP